MLEVDNDLNCIKKNKILLCIISIFIILSIYIAYIYMDYTNNFVDIDERTKYMKNLEWTFIKSIIYEDHLAAKNQARLIADKLTIDLIKAYPDLDILKQELNDTSKTKNLQYFHIMQNCIKDAYLFDVNEDKSANHMFICNKYGMLASVSPRARKNITKFPFLWKELYQEQTNLQLTKEAVNSLLQQKDILIYWEIPNTDKDKIIIPHEMDIEILHKLYDQYGLRVFKNIHFLAPAYITPTGDIFGIDDISIYGEKSDNNKIIVVQTFNVYQQIMARYSSDISQINAFKNHIITHPINTLYINAIFIILIIIIMMILICFVVVQYEKNKILENIIKNKTL